MEVLISVVWVLFLLFIIIVGVPVKWGMAIAALSFLGALVLCYIFTNRDVGNG